LYNDDDVIQQQTKDYRQEDVALRLLAFGQESSEMLSSIHTVFDDTIQRAESWIERLRMMNPMSSSIQLPNITQNQEEEEDFYNVLLPPIRNLHISTSTSSSTTTPSSTAAHI
jgi:hypothetical protein